MLRFLKVLFIAVITFIFIVFAVANRAVVEVSFFPLPYDAGMPLFLLAIACFSVGAMVAGLLMSLRLFQYQHRLSREHKRMVALENELKGIKNEQFPIPASSRGIVAGGFAPRAAHGK